MQELQLSEIINATKGRLLEGNADIKIHNISTDSRNIAKGDLYVALEGERFDGHTFVQEAFNKGAIACLTHKDMIHYDGKTIIKVENTSRGLLDIARSYRRKFNIPFIGVTGSVGKTSTKDMLAEVLGMRYNVLKNRGNFNNEIGVPLTLFELDCFHEIGILEMGMNNLGEISRLSSTIMPDIAVITNIGLSHVGNLGSKQNILKAKLEVLDGLNKDGIVFLNGDDQLLKGLRSFIKYKTIFFGTDDDVDFQAYNIRLAGEEGTYFDITIKNKEYNVHISTPGVHYVYCALVSIAVGTQLGVDIQDIIKGIKNFSTGDMRLGVISHKGLKIINDTYNASPSSMEAAIAVLKEIGLNKRKIAILGDMLEMGDYSYKAHFELGNFLTINRIDYIITVGENAKYIADGAVDSGFNKEKIYSFENAKDVEPLLERFEWNNDVVLVKGSRGMKMETIVDKIKEL